MTKEKVMTMLGLGKSKDPVKLTKSDKWTGWICSVFMVLWMIVLIPFYSWANSGIPTKDEYVGVVALFLGVLIVVAILMASIVPLRRYEILKADVKELKAKLNLK